MNTVTQSGEILEIKISEAVHDHSECRSSIIPVKDALEVLGGKWKLQIIISLIPGTRRFMEISRAVRGISDRMLSKELKELEMHQLVKRTVQDSFPPVVRYELTDHGNTLFAIIDELNKWGMMHRKKVLGL